MSVTRADGSIYCRCGAMFSARLRGPGAGEALIKLTDAWAADHTGAGHGDASAQQAAAARRRAEESIPR